MKKKTAADIAMTVILPVLMAYSLVGETLHEWIGVTMFLLFILHHAWNARWYKSLGKGRHSAVRTVNTVLDLVLLFDMLLQMVSAILVSKHVFTFLDISSGASIGRVLHMLGAYWGFVLMSLHLGLHAGTLEIRLWIHEKHGLRTFLRILFAAVSAYGIYAFLKRQLASYLFLRQMFVFFDTDEPLILFLLDYLAIMILIAALAHYGMKALQRAGKKRRTDPEKTEKQAVTEEEGVLLLKGQRRKKRRIVLAMLGVLLIAAALIWGIPYFRRHFVTVRIDREQATAMAPVDLGKTLVIYFTRNGNSNFDADVDATSSASLMLDGMGRLVGNAELLAEMAKNATGGDIYAIRVAENSRYPSSYGGTISAASDEFDGKRTPQLDPANGLPDVQNYESIIVICPIWWWKVPKAVEVFLGQVDWTGKEVHLVVTHGGSGAGGCPRDMAPMLKGGTLSDNVLTVYDDDADEAADQIYQWLKSLK